MLTAYCGYTRFFCPHQRAFYNVRALEIPKPRFKANDAKFFSVNTPQVTSMVVYDAAYSSSKWLHDVGSRTLPVRVSFGPSPVADITFGKHHD